MNELPTDGNNEPDIFQHLFQSDQNTTNVQENPLRFYAHISTNGKERNQKALIDTGSTFSSITEEIARSLALHTDTCGPTMIHYGNQSTQMATAKARLQFLMEGVETEAYVYIVSKQNEDVILGMDWMINEDIVLHPRSKLIQKNGHQVGMTQNQADIRIDHETQKILDSYPNLTDESITQTVTNAPYQHRIDTAKRHPSWYATTVEHQQRRKR